jgi:hypothetical protein
MRHVLLVLCSWDLPAFGIWCHITRWPCPKFWEMLFPEGQISSLEDETSMPYQNNGHQSQWHSGISHKNVDCSYTFKDNTTWGRKFVSTASWCTCPQLLRQCSVEFLTQSWGMPEAPMSFMALCRQHITINTKHLMVPGKFQFVRQHCYH